MSIKFELKNGKNLMKHSGGTWTRETPTNDPYLLKVEEISEQQAAQERLADIDHDQVTYSLKKLRGF